MRAAGLSVPGRRVRPRRRRRGRGVAERLRSRARLGGLVVVVVASLAAGGFLWLRDSSLVAVQSVAVTGLRGPTAPAMRDAVRDVALDMTTLHVRRDELRRALSSYPVVREVRVERDLPHRLHIDLVLYDPVATVVLGGRRIPVASDGTLLPGEVATADLPSTPPGRSPGAARLTDRSALAAVALLGAAPPALRPLIDTIRRDQDGVHVTLRAGPRLDFGAPTRPRTKWAAAARVLADPRAAGASYVDLRVPGRPVAGTFTGDSLPDPLGDPAAATGTSGPQPAERAVASQDTAESETAATGAAETAAGTG